MSRILLTTHNMAGIGGSFARSFSLARHLVPLGYQVTLLASRRVPGLKLRISNESGVRIVEFPDLFPERFRHGALSPMDMLGRASHMVRNQYDIIHTFEHRPAVFPPAILGRRRKPTVLISDWADLWGRGGIKDERSGLLEGLLGTMDHIAENNIRRWVDGVTLATPYLKERVIRQGVEEGRIMVLLPGANTDLIQPLDKQRARRLLELPEGDHYLVHVGYADYDEELLADTVIQVLVEDAHIRFLHAGKPLPLLFESAERSSLGHRIHFFDHVPLDRLQVILAAGDVMLLPYSNKEINLGRMPNKIGDYLAAGRPVVTNPTGVLGDLVAREGVGITVKEDPSSFAEGTIGLLRDPTRSHEMGRNARGLAEGEMGWRHHAEQVDRFYSELRGGVLS